VGALGAYSAGEMRRFVAQWIFLANYGVLGQRKKWFEDGNTAARDRPTKMADIGDTVGDPLKDTAARALNR